MKEKMTKAYNLDEADEFFRENHSDNLICVKDGIENEVNCYPEAKKFFEN